MKSSPVPAGEQPLTLRPSQIAKLLSVRRSTVYRWVEDGVLPASKIGQVILVQRVDVEALLRSHQLPGRPGRREDGAGSEGQS